MSNTPDHIIDFRSRPAFLAEFYGSTPGTVGHETAKWLSRHTGSQDETHFHESFTLDGYLRVGLDSCEILEKLCQPSDLAKKLASTI